MDAYPQLAAYLRQRAPDASYGHPGYWMNVQLGPGWSSDTVEALAETFVADADFQALRLGRWLGTPEGHLIAATVEMGLPYPYRQYSQLFVLALTRAAELQAAQQKDKAKSYALAGRWSGRSGTSRVYQQERVSKLDLNGGFPKATC